LKNVGFTISRKKGAYIVSFDDSAKLTFTTKSIGRQYAVFMDGKEVGRSESIDDKTFRNIVWNNAKNLITDEQQRSELYRRL